MSRSSLLSATVLACSVGLVCAHAQQQQLETAAPFSLRPDTLLKAAAEAPSPAGTDIVVLLEDTRLEFDSQGRMTETWRLVFKAINDKGAQDWGMVEGEWSPWRQVRPELRARVVSADGSVHELDQATVADVPVDDDDDILTDRKSVRAPLPAMAAGAVVEQEVVYRDTAPLLPVGASGSSYFGRTVPILHTRLTLSAPAALALRYKSRLLPALKTERHEQDGLVVTTFDLGALAADEDLPPLLPPDEPRRPRIVYTTVPAWNDVAKAYGDVVDRQIGDAKLKPVVHDLVGKLNGREETIAAILHGLNKRVRYTGLEFGQSAIVPHAPAETLQHGYGDCKDKAALLVAALRTAGIGAHVALLYAEDGEDIDAEYPGIRKFNHAIVYVPGSPALWLDPTDPDLRPGVLPESDQGRWALIADRATKELVHTPEATSAENRIVETREFQLAETGGAHVVETGESWGTLEASFRSDFGYGETKANKESIRKYVEWSYASSEPASVSHEPADDFSHPYKLRIEVTKAARGTTWERGADVAIRVDGLDSRLPGWFSEAEKKDAAKGDSSAPAAKRTQDFYIPRPLAHEWRYRIVPPPGFRMRELPEPENRQMGPATLTTVYSTGPDNVVTATLRFEIPRRRFSAEQGLALREAVLKLDGESMRMIHFEQTGFALLADGKVKEALAEFEALERLHPNEALHHSQLSLALLEAGAGEMARAEARRAVELEPASAAAWNNLGWVLRHDPIGRQDQKGADFAGAAAAYRKGKKLDPKDYVGRGNLAIALEYNPDGVRYGKGAPLDQAIAEYQEMKDKLAELGAPDNLAYALMRAHRFSDLRVHLQTLDNADTRRTLNAVADAALDGTAKAIGNARKAGDDAQRNQALLSAGQNLLQIRMYDLAADLFAEGAKAAPQPGATLALVDGLRRTRRLEDVSFAGDRPEDAFYQLMQLTAARPGDLHTLEPLFSERWRNPDGLKDLASVGRKLRTVAPGLTLDVATDIGVALTTVTADGSDASGWRLRMQTPGTTQQPTFMVREGGAYRILAMGGDYSGVGRLVLELAGQDKLDEARAWLDRIREEVVPAGGDDPLGGPEFARLWKRGSKAPKDGIRVAAAALLVDHDSSAAEAIPILREYRDKLPAGEERNVVDRALASALSITYKDAEFLDVVRGLSERVPDSLSACSLYVRALERTGGWKELDEVAAHRFDNFPDPAVGTRILAGAYATRGDFTRSNELLSALVKTGKALANDYNGLGWNALFEGSVGKDAFDAIDRANMMTQQNAPGILHTAAAMYAEVGRTKEARTTILRRMEIGGKDEPDDEDWYVFGRILEQEGLKEAARSAYKKLKKPEHAWMEPLMSYALAQRRLAALSKP
jgi:tetratricopeptide (TPR) repeat protein/transglutaminase-like putative cysteine protease